MEALNNKVRQLSEHLRRITGEKDDLSSQLIEGQ